MKEIIQTITTEHLGYAEDIVFELLPFISKECKYARLILEEWITNIMKYSGVAPIEITIRFPEDSDCTSITIADNGHPFNLMDYPKNGTDIWTIGGKGIFLIKEFSKSLHYAYTDHQNVLTIQFV